MEFSLVVVGYRKAFKANARGRESSHLGIRVGTLARAVMEFPHM